MESRNTKVIARSLSTKVKRSKGNLRAVALSCVAVRTASARRAWSKAAVRRWLTASTTTNRLPPATEVRYQNRSVAPIQFGSSATPTTSPGARAAKLSARA